MMYITLYRKRLVTRTKSISEARSDLPRLVREAEEGGAIELTRRGERVAVLIGRREYERLASRTHRFSDAWDRFIADVNLVEIDVNPDVVFSDVRDPGPGREP